MRSLPLRAVAVTAGLAFLAPSCSPGSSEHSLTPQEQAERDRSARDFYSILDLGRITVIKADGDPHEVGCGGDLHTMDDSFGVQVGGGASAEPIEVDVAVDTEPLTVTNEAHGDLVATSNSCEGGVSVELKSIAVLSGGQGLQTWEITNPDGPSQTILVADREAAEQQ